MIQYRNCALCLALFLATGCAAPLSERAAHIELTERSPACQYDELGEISADHGYIPMQGQSAEWHKVANEDLVDARLRERADAMGAHAVVIRTKERVNLPDGRPARIVKNGVAISGCH